MKLVFPLLLLFASLNCMAQKTSMVNDKRIAALDTAFERALKTWKAAGFSVAVVEKNKLIYAKGFGYRDMEKKLPVTPNTLFAIGSCTKAFTNSLIGLMQKEGKLDIDKTEKSAAHMCNDTADISLSKRNEIQDDYYNSQPF